MSPYAIDTLRKKRRLEDDIVISKFLRIANAQMRLFPHKQTSSYYFKTGVFKASWHSRINVAKER